MIFATKVFNMPFMVYNSLTVGAAHSVLLRILGCRTRDALHLNQLAPYQSFAFRVKIIPFTDAMAVFTQAFWWFDRCAMKFLHGDQSLLLICLRNLKD